MKFALIHEPRDLIPRKCKNLVSIILSSSSSSRSSSSGNICCCSSGGGSGSVSDNI